jgi:N-methylhydantoinase B
MRISPERTWSVRRLPSPAGHYLVRYGTDLLARVSEGVVPAGIEDLQAERTAPLRAKSNGAALTSGDVMEIRVGGGGGYGDPLERDPARVARDVTLGYVSASAASEVYGVVSAPDGSVAASSTERFDRSCATRARPGSRLPRR